MSKGLDTTESCAPHAVALKKLGYTWVARYSSHSAWKNMTRAEVLALSKAGLHLVNVWESAGDHESFFTRAQGLMDGAAAYAFAQHLGQPFSAPIYFAVDADVSGGAVHAYFDAVRESLQKHGTIGKTTYAVGAYGSGTVLSYLASAGMISFTWLAQAMGWSGSARYTDWNIKQLSSITVLGMNVDGDTAAAKGGGGFQVV